MRSAWMHEDAGTDDPSPFRLPLGSPGRTQCSANWRRRSRKGPGTLRFRGPWGESAHLSSSSSFFSTTRVSVVSSREAMEAALASAERVTFTGSMTPASMRFS